MTNMLRMTIEDWCGTARKAAEEAGKAIMEVYNSADAGLSEKSDRSPLTEADKRAHAIISRHLSETGLPVLSEEGRSVTYEERRGWEMFWLVDPLDGTKEFISRNGDFTVNIALIKEGRPVLGVVHIPVTGESFWGGTLLEGVWKCGSAGQAIRIATTPAKSKPAEGIRVVASRSHMDERTRAFLDMLDQPVLTARGSSLKFLMLAEGSADVYPRFAPTMEWDTAAAQGILEALGIPTISVDDRLPLRYNKEDLRNPGFISGHWPC